MHTWHIWHSLIERYIWMSMCASNQNLSNSFPFYIPFWCVHCSCWLIDECKSSMSSVVQAEILELTDLLNVNIQRTKIKSKSKSKCKIQKKALKQIIWVNQSAFLFFRFNSVWYFVFQMVILIEIGKYHIKKRTNITTSWWCTLIYSNENNKKKNFGGTNLS